MTLVSGEESKPFLATFPLAQIASRKYSFRRNERSLRRCVRLVGIVGFLAVAATLFSWLIYPNTDRIVVGAEDHIQSHQEDVKLHVLLPATDPDVNLCRTVLSALALGYPTPTIVGWRQTYNDSTELGAGSHMGKIMNTLRYLEGLRPSQDNEIVLMADAYDIWFQLPPSVLIARYFRLNAEANRRIVQRMGSAAVAAGTNQTIIFAAGKRCAPNLPHTVACYPLPDPPIRKDLYGQNTDTIIGRNKYYSARQRYLNSGYIMGPVADLRRLFAHARDRIDAHLDNNGKDPNDNGSHNSDDIYHGSDQSVFNTIFGEQEFQREGRRRRNLSWVQRNWLWLSQGGTHTSSIMEGTPIDDVLNPSFTHQPMEPIRGLAYEFGIGLDYTSDLGHQTVNSELDARWLLHSQSLRTQLHQHDALDFRNRNQFDCKMDLRRTLPEDIQTADRPFSSPGWPSKSKSAHSRASWRSVYLYTHLCYGTIPVLIHHNGRKQNRARHWNKMWFQKDARALVGYQGTISTQNRTSADTGELLSWDGLCPADLESLLGRG